MICLLYTSQDDSFLQFPWCVIMIIYIVPYFSGRLFMEILTDPEQISQHIRDIYKPNHFLMDYFHINIEGIHCGSATVSRFV